MPRSILRHFLSISARNGATSAWLAADKTIPAPIIAGKCLNIQFDKLRRLTCSSAQHPCGAQNPTRVNSSTISTMASTATSAGSQATGASQTTGINSAQFSGFGGSPTQTASSNNNNNGKGAAAALDLGRAYGLAVVFAGVFAGFAILL
jgi:hypothetical protein